MLLQKQLFPTQVRRQYLTTAPAILKIESQNGANNGETLLLFKDNSTFYLMGEKLTNLKISHCL